MGNRDYQIAEKVPEGNQGESQGPKELLQVQPEPAVELGPRVSVKPEKKKFTSDAFAKNRKLYESP